MEHSTDRNMIPLKVLLPVGIIIFIILAIISIVSITFLSKIPFIIITFCSFILLLLIAVKRFGRPIAFGVGLAFFSSIVLGLGVGDVLNTIYYKSIDNISIDEVIKYSDYNILSFNNGIIKKELAGEMSKTIKTKHSLLNIYSCYAAPVVLENWKKEDPIKLWAGTNKKSDMINWDKPYRKGFRITTNIDCYITAISNAKNTHKITSIKNAPIIVWTDNPSGELYIKILISGLISTFFILIWLIATPILRSKNKL